MKLEVNHSQVAVFIMLSDSENLDTTVYIAFNIIFTEESKKNKWRNFSLEASIYTWIRSILKILFLKNLRVCG